MRTFPIYVGFNEKSGTWNAGALGCQGIWSRSLGQALESLLDQLIFVGIKVRMDEILPAEPTIPGPESS
jgi:hypothetical protein